MSLTHDKTDLLFFLHFGLSKLLSLELCLCRWPWRGVHRAALCHCGWRVGGCLASGKVCGGTLGRDSRVEGVTLAGGWIGRGVVAQHCLGAASPSLLMVSGASQDQWLCEGGFCWPHFVQDEIHIYPPPHEDR